MTLDGVDAVAIGAGGRMHVALGDRLTMNARHEFRFLRLVALCAGLRNIGFEDR